MFWVFHQSKVVALVLWGSSAGADSKTSARLDRQSQHVAPSGIPWVSVSRAGLERVDRGLYTEELKG